MAASMMWCVLSGKLTGNDPNMDPLDAHLFSDYKGDIARAVAYTSGNPDGHPETYHLKTPRDVRRTMKRVWEWSPSSERIVQDIAKWPAHLQLVLDAKGAKVPAQQRGKRVRTREFKPPPDCPLTTAMLRIKFRELDPESLPPKKRGRVS